MKICAGCGKAFQKGYFIKDDFSGDEGYLCESCFDTMCFNKIKDRLVGIMKIKKDTLTFEFSLTNKKT